MFPFSAARPAVCRQTCSIRSGAGVGKQHGDDAGRGAGDGCADGDLLDGGPVEALDAQGRVQVLPDRVRCGGQEPGRIGQLADQGGAIVQRGLGGDRVQLGLQGGGRVVEPGVVLADPGPVGGGVVAELNESRSAGLCRLTSVPEQRG